MFINNLAYQYQVSSEVEQWIDNPLVSGSIPLPGTILKCIAEQTNGGEPMSSAFQYGRTIHTKAHCKPWARSCLSNYVYNCGNSRLSRMSIANSAMRFSMVYWGVSDNGSTGALQAFSRSSILLSSTKFLLVVNSLAIVCRHKILVLSKC